MKSDEIPNRNDTKFEKQYKRLEKKYPSLFEDISMAGESLNRGQ